MPGINLSCCCWLERVDFSHCCLVGAAIGCCPGARFVDADLTGATVAGDITGVDFSGTILEGLRLESGSYAHHKVEKGSDGYLVFVACDRPNNDEPWGRCSFTARLSADAPGKILAFNCWGAGSFYESVITNDGRTATAS